VQTSSHFNYITGIYIFFSFFAFHFTGIMAHVVACVRVNVDHLNVSSHEEQYVTPPPPTIAVVSNFKLVAMTSDIDTVDGSVGVVEVYL
jgi:hypothetical protein